MRFMPIGMMAILLAAASQAAAQNQRAPTCKAIRQGETIVTRFEHPDGYSVEGPWRVTARKQVSHSAAVTAVLDHIVETAAPAAPPTSTPLPNVVEMTFEGPTLDDVLLSAANLWCVTVLQARASWPMRGRAVTLADSKIMP